MHAMFSAEKEKVNFVNKVNPIGLNVEEWMSEVESMMYKSVREVMIKAIQDYKVKDRKVWVKIHPGQTILNGSQTHWTTEVEGAFPNGVKAYWTSKLEPQLLDLVFLVRQKLTKQQQVTLNALIVIDVHAKDVVEKLWTSEVNSVGAFEWISQLRYYWEENNLRVKCV